MAARPAGCISRDGRPLSLKTAMGCRSGSWSPNSSTISPHSASSSRSRRRAQSLLRYPKHPKQRSRPMSDYDELPEVFDPSAHEGTGDLECFPPGWYLAQIIESEVRDAQNGNGNYLLAV